MNNKLVISGGVGALSIFLWEHFARPKSKDSQETPTSKSLVVKYRPSSLIGAAAGFSSQQFTKFGSSLAWLSSFYAQLDLNEISFTLMSITNPVIKLALSPYHTFRGYYNKISSYNQKSVLVVAGSVTLFVLGSKVYQLTPDECKHRCRRLSNILHLQSS